MWSSDLICCCAETDKLICRITSISDVWGIKSGHHSVSQKYRDSQLLSTGSMTHLQKRILWCVDIDKGHLTCVRRTNQFPLLYDEVTPELTALYQLHMNSLSRDDKLTPSHRCISDLVTWSSTFTTTALIITILNLLVLDFVQRHFNNIRAHAPYACMRACARVCLAHLIWIFQGARFGICSLLTSVFDSHYMYLFTLWLKSMLLI